MLPREMLGQIKSLRKYTAVELHQKKKKIPTLSSQMYLFTLRFVPQMDFE
jgi:hypothetical protein